MKRFQHNRVISNLFWRFFRWNCWSSFTNHRATWASYRSFIIRLRIQKGNLLWFNFRTFFFSKCIVSYRNKFVLYHFLSCSVDLKNIKKLKLLAIWLAIVLCCKWISSLLLMIFFLLSLLLFFALLLVINFNVHFKLKKEFVCLTYFIT